MSIPEPKNLHEIATTDFIIYKMNDGISKTLTFYSIQTQDIVLNTSCGFPMIQGEYEYINWLKFA